MDATFTLTVNGEPRTVTADPQRPLLDVLREELRLTGTKYGCGEGQCGACTVLIAYLKQHSDSAEAKNPFQTELSQAAKKLRQTYYAAYVQHAPLEPRTALAEWAEGRLTVWTGTQNPFGYHRELAAAFRLPNDRVRVIVPDFDAGFGGKHTGEAAIEAARLAQAAGRPVLLRWTREEEFTWAYFRPAAVIEAEASLAADGRLTSWHFRGDSESRQPAIAGPGLRPDGPGTGVAGGDAVCRGADAERLVRRLPGTAFRGRAGIGYPPAEPA